MKLTRFEDLQCWQEATSLAVDIYKITSEGKIASDFGLRDQIRRSAVSIASNIAEGRERETPSEFIRFLYIAKGSAGELRTQIYIAKEIGYLSDEKYQELKEKIERLGGMLGSLIKTLKKGK